AGVAQSRGIAEAVLSEKAGGLFAFAIGQADQLATGGVAFENGQRAVLVAEHVDEPAVGADGHITHAAKPDNVIAVVAVVRLIAQAAKVCAAGVGLAGKQCQRVFLAPQDIGMSAVGRERESSGAADALYVVDAVFQAFKQLQLAVVAAAWIVGPLHDCN